MGLKVSLKLFFPWIIATHSYKQFVLYFAWKNMQYGGCYGGVKIFRFYFSLIEPKVSLQLKIIFLCLRPFVNIVCNIIYNLDYYIVIWCASNIILAVTMLR